MTDAPPPTAAIVLAGGAARRMGGGDKTLLRLEGATLLDRIAARLAPSCAPLILGAGGAADRFGRADMTVVPDPWPDRRGPLAGILAGLDWLAEHRPDRAWLLSVPGDAPFLPPDLVARLHAARIEAGTPFACARSGGRLHPVHALWPVSSRGALRAAIEAGERRVGAWAATQGLATATWASEPVDPFFNVNDPDDLAAAAAIARGAGGPG